MTSSTNQANTSTGGGPLRIRTRLAPGDLGDLIRLHGVVYSAECGWDHTFEAYVAESLARFALAHDPARERIWVVEENGRIAGSIGIVAVSIERAQLWWFLLSAEIRGKGLGHQLLQEAIEFCRRTGYRKVILWTVRGLSAAAHLYGWAGFRRTIEEEHARWGANVIEERWDLDFD